MVGKSTVVSVKTSKMAKRKVVDEASTGRTNGVDGKEQKKKKKQKHAAS